MLEALPREGQSSGPAITGCELSRSVLWPNRPDWLGEPSLLVDDKQQGLPAEECLKESKKKNKCAADNLLTTNEPGGISQIIKSENFSSLRRLLRTTAIVMKFLALLKPRVETTEPPPTRAIMAEDIMEAENSWIREAQKPMLKEKEFDTWKRQFGLFCDHDGIGRCGGRLANASLPFVTKHPALLDQRHSLTTLIVKDAHQCVMHNGVKETPTEVRSRYWIIKGGSFVRQVIRQCFTCRGFDGLPHHAPPPPPLPEFRVKEVPPFAHTGVDFAGPLYVRTTEGSSKVWIRLYTCCVIRAVHLDLVPDMTAQAFVKSLKRFIARRGFPRKIVSDNGKTFRQLQESSMPQ